MTHVVGHWPRDAAGARTSVVVTLPHLRQIKYRSPSLFHKALGLRCVINLSHQPGALPA